MEMVGKKVEMVEKKVKMVGLGKEVEMVGLGHYKYVLICAGPAEWFHGPWDKQKI